MEYILRCSCGYQMRVQERQIGHTGNCKRCGKRVTASREALMPVLPAVGSGTPNQRMAADTTAGASVPRGQGTVLPGPANPRVERKAGEVQTFAGIEMVWCPPGSFLMGSPEGKTDWHSDETQHRVTLTQGFWLGKYEVTQGQWEAVMGSNPSLYKGDKNLPVEQVSWEDCQAYVRKLNGSGEGGFRLPTESEWEYACRAGTTSEYVFGNDAGALDGYAWYWENSGETTHPVGKKKPNTWGLYDMHGNVWEWCQDWFGDYPSGSVTDPQGSRSQPSRVLRGGSWSRPPMFCRSAFRYRNDPTLWLKDIGFRVCRSSGSR